MANPNLTAGPGRPKGLPNKATQQAREAIGRFVDNNAERLQEWLDKIAEKDPEKAFSLFQSVIEYHVPKLARTELSGDQNNPVAITLQSTDQEIINRYILSKSLGDKDGTAKS